MIVTITDHPQNSLLSRSWGEFAGWFSTGSAFVATQSLEGLAPVLSESLKKSLNSRDLEIWNAILNDHRRVEWIAGRMARSQVVEALGASALTSLSHNEDCSIAVGLARQGSWVGAGVGAAAPTVEKVGVDIESSSREIEVKVRERVFRSGELERSGLSAIQGWVAKEAAYKANPRSEGTVVWNYLIQSYDHSRGVGVITSPSGGRLEFRVTQISGQASDWTVGFALGYSG